MTIAAFLHPGQCIVVPAHAQTLVVTNVDLHWSALSLTEPSFRAVLGVHTAMVRWFVRLATCEDPLILTANADVATMVSE